MRKECAMSINVFKSSSDRENSKKADMPTPISLS